MLDAQRFYSFFIAAGFAVTPAPAFSTSSPPRSPVVAAKEFCPRLDLCGRDVSRLRRALGISAILRRVRVAFHRSVCWRATSSGLASHESEPARRCPSKLWPFSQPFRSRHRHGSSQSQDALFFLSFIRNSSHPGSGISFCNSICMVRRVDATARSPQTDQARPPERNRSRTNGRC